MRAFFHQGTLYRDDGETMEFYRKVRQGHWEWKPIKGFAARKIRRVLKLRTNIKQVNDDAD
jgi:hypothetical protein